MASYQILPQVYDRWQKSYGNDFSTLILPRFLAALISYRIPTSTMLDLACGTGTLAIKMAKRGWSVWGVDGSEGMLTEGRKKLDGSTLPVVLLCQDMRDFSLPVQVNVVTSFFDSINHLLSKKDLLRTFRAVYRSLLPGGYLMFDMNNESCFKTLWVQTEAIHQDDFTIILQNSYDADRRYAKADVTLFIKKGANYERSTETVYERCFTPSEINSVLRQAGFKVVKSEDFNFTNLPHVGKIKTWWVAQKPLAS